MHPFYSALVRGFWPAFLSLSVMVLVGCGGSSSGGGDEVDPPDSGGSFAGRLTGVLTAPNGSSPVPGATVYIADDGAAPLGYDARMQAFSSASTECSEPPVTSLAWGCTDDQGRFGFDIDLSQGSEVELRAFRGAWSLVAMVVLDGSDAGAFAFSADPEKGAARIAVVTGDYDAIENVLAKMGMAEVEQMSWPVASAANVPGHNGPSANFQGYRHSTDAVAFQLADLSQTTAVAQARFVEGTETFDLYDGIGDPSEHGGVEDLLRPAEGEDRPRIFDYDIVYINCGARDPDMLANWREILRAYVHGGGILYVTDLSSPYVTSPFNEYVSTAGSGNSLESLTARVEDADLRSYLGNTTCEGGAACISPAGDVSLYQFGSGWDLLAPVVEMQGSEVQKLVTADVSEHFYSDLPDDQSGLTLSFSHGEGRVLFSSYHVSGLFGGGDFNAQERILERLFWITAGNP